MTKEIIEQKYKKIWAKYSEHSFSNILERGFAFQFDEDETECNLLFIGINPAYSISDRSWPGGSYSRPIGKIEQERAYFRPFMKISEILKEDYHWNGKWSHIDIFAFRETSQKKVEKEIVKNKECKSFLFDQVKFTGERILHIKPKVIVVSNALARMFTGKERGGEEGNEHGVWMGFRFDFDEKIGTDVIIEPLELKGTPVFFTSMLSGQRSLDIGSRERLVWHIAQALKLKK